MADSLEKLPELASNIAAIVEKTGAMAESAGDEIGGLGLMGKVKATKALVLNSKAIAGVPALATSTTKKLKGTLEDINSTINML
jgi:hypothetical protein